MHVHRLAAFADGNQGGNEAGVVLEAEDLTTDRMQEVAAATGYSETAFLLEAEDADYRVRYFTPKQEVDVCGHATLALLWLLFASGLECGRCTLKTKAGLIEGVAAAQPELRLPTPAVRLIDPSEAEPYATLFPVPFTHSAVVDSGVKEVYLRIDESFRLDALAPSTQALTAQLIQDGLAGAAVYALGEVDDRGYQQVQLRNFLSAIGIVEESATGTAAASLAQLLHEQGYGSRYLFTQGHALKKPSRLHATVGRNAVHVGGAVRRLDTATRQTESGG